MRLLLLVCFVTTFANASAQRYNVKAMRDSFYLESSGTQFLGMHDINPMDTSLVAYARKVILLDDTFDDSLLVYVNDRLVAAKIILSDKRTTRIVVPNTQNGKYYALSLFLPRARCYTEVSLDTRYKYLRMTRDKQPEKKGFWSVTETNHN